MYEDADAPGVFLPAELLDWEQWSEGTLERARWALYFVQLESTGEVEPAMARRPSRPGNRGGGMSGRPQAPLLNPRPTREQLEARRRQNAELRAVHLARERYFQAMQEAQARYPQHHGYQEHHFIPIFLGGPRDGVTYRLPSAYHQAITQEFRRLWKYGQGRTPETPELQRILLEVYSRYPIPQLIGITP
jgi:hypothetical protein